MGVGCHVSEGAMSVGDAKCEYCKRGTDIERRDDFCHAAIIRPLGGRSPISEAECAAITRVRAPLDTEIARLTAEVARLHRDLDEALAMLASGRDAMSVVVRERNTAWAKFDEAEARWRSAERQCNNWHCEVPGCPPSRTVVTGNVSVTQGVRATWSPADRERRCPEHTTREGAGEMATP